MYPNRQPSTPVQPYRSSQNGRPHVIHDGHYLEHLPFHAQQSRSSLPHVPWNVRRMPSPPGLWVPDPSCRLRAADLPDAACCMLRQGSRWMSNTEADKHCCPTRHLPDISVASVIVKLPKWTRGLQPCPLFAYHGFGGCEHVSWVRRRSFGVLVRS
jgi:hypothetical protein